MKRLELIGLIGMFSFMLADLDKIIHTDITPFGNPQFAELKKLEARMEKIKEMLQIALNECE